MALIDYVHDPEARDTTANLGDVGGDGDQAQDPAGGADDDDEADGADESDGKPSLFLAVLANNPTVLEARRTYTGTLRYEGSLDPVLKELAHVVVDQTNECAYCTASHSENLVEVYGFDRDRVREIRERNFESFSEREQAVMRFAEQVATDPKRVTADHIERYGTSGSTTPTWSNCWPWSRRPFPRTPSSRRSMSTQPTGATTWRRTCSGLRRTASP